MTHHHDNGWIQTEQGFIWPTWVKVVSHTPSDEDTAQEAQDEEQEQEQGSTAHAEAEAEAASGPAHDVTADADDDDDHDQSQSADEKQDDVTEPDMRKSRLATAASKSWSRQASFHNAVAGLSIGHDHAPFCCRTDVCLQGKPSPSHCARSTVALGSRSPRGSYMCLVDVLFVSYLYLQLSASKPPALPFSFFYFLSSCPVFQIAEGALLRGLARACMQARRCGGTPEV